MSLAMVHTRARFGVRPPEVRVSVNDRGIGEALAFCDTSPTPANPRAALTCPQAAA